ncbi:MAG: hypothetical protein EXS11_05485 [Gemmataceae bacterium]|nr:hypothetical protein [Gemmataceae bacterium]
MPITVSDFFDAIVQNQILGLVDIETLKARWNKAGREAANDASKLARWMVVNQYLTVYQCEKILKRKADELVVDNYRVKDLVASGPMQGWLIAEDNLRRPTYLEQVSPAISTDPTKSKALVDAIKTASVFQNPQVSKIIGLVQQVGKEFLAREYASGESLQSLVNRKVRLKPLQVAKLFSLLFSAFTTLRGSGAYPGKVTLESFWLCQSGKPGASHKTIRVIDSLVDPMLLGNAASDSPSETETIHKLGVAMYELLTLQSPNSQPVPVASLVSEIPDLIAEFVDSLVMADSNQGPVTLAAIGKQLRVVLAAEENNKHVEMEELVVVSVVHGPSKKVNALGFAQSTEDDDSLSAANRFLEMVKGWLEKAGIATRDLILFTAGSLSFLFIIILVLVVFAFDLVPLFCLGLGAALGYGIERFLKHAEATESAAAPSSQS